MMHIEEIVKRENVQAFLQNYRKVLETRSIVGAELTIPEEFLGIIRENIEQYSKLYKYMTVRTVKGRGRIAVMGTVPEAIWTEACGALTELSINMTGIEVAEWKVGGYVSVCNATLEDSDIDLANEILRVIGGAIGYAIDKTAIYGTGVKEPKGVALGKTAASITGSGAQLLRDILYASAEAKGKYSAGKKVWLMNPDTLDALRAQSIYAAGTGIVSGILDSVETFDFIPDGEIIVGYFDLYLLADRGDVRLKRTTEKQFVEDHTLLLGAARIDGVPVIPEAFTVIDFEITDDPTPGGKPTPITITENGTYTRGDGYSPVVVDVPEWEPTGDIKITSNGNYNVANYATASVSVGDPIVFYDGDVTVENGQFTVTSTKMIVDDRDTQERALTVDIQGAQNARPAVYISYVNTGGWNFDYTTPLTNVRGQISDDGIKQLTFTTTLPDGIYHVKLTESVDKYAPTTVTENGSHNVTNTNIVKVNVQSSGGDTLAQAIMGTLGEYENNEITAVPAYAFDGLKVTKLTLPAVEEVGTKWAGRNGMDGYAFYNLLATDINVPSLRRVVGNRNFGFSGIINVNWENFETDILPNTFEHCDALESISVRSGKSNKVGMNTSACTSCNSLERVELHCTSVLQGSIASNAFNSCGALVALVLDGHKNPGSSASPGWALSGVNAFSGTPIASGTGYVYVPDDEVDIYKAATNWSTYADQIKPLSEYQG